LGTRYRCGPEIQDILKKSDIDYQITRLIVPDDEEAIKEGVIGNLDKDFVLTTGGTGLSHRDITTEITSAICDKSIPGILEYLRLESLKDTLFATLSREYSGQKGETVIINLPGSMKGASFCTRLLLYILPYAKAMREGEKH